MRSTTHLLCTLFGALSLACRAQAATVTVTGSGDTSTVDGLVTLREAIASINAGANVNADVVAAGSYGTSDTIDFNIGGAGVHTISVASQLPSLVKPVTIDGYSQPGSSANTLAIGEDAVLEIEIQGPPVLTFQGIDILTGGSGSVSRWVCGSAGFYDRKKSWRSN